MTRIVVTSFAAALLPLGIAWSAAAGGDLSPGGYASGPSCDIRVARAGGNLVLEGLVMTSVPATGSYELRISQSGYGGQSSIRQGGEFEAAPGIDPSLGLVSLPAKGGYAATLVVRWHDGAPDCTRHVGTERRL